MVPKAGLVVLDSNLFIIDLRYPRDRSYRLNREFLARLPELAPAATTLVNLLEVCGILSFNLTAQEIRELYHYLPERYHVAVLPPPTFPMSPPVEPLLTLLTRKLSLGDALCWRPSRPGSPGRPASFPGMPGTFGARPRSP